MACHAIHIIPESNREISRLFLCVKMVVKHEENKHEVTEVISLCENKGKNLKEYPCTVVPVCINNQHIIYRLTLINTSHEIIIRPEAVTLHK